VGSWEEYRIPPAVSPGHSAVVEGLHSSIATAVHPSHGGQSDVPTKKEISSFHELLNSFPIIARQMQPGLEKLFHEFTVVFGGQLPPPPSAPDIPDPLPEGPITASVRKTRAHSVSIDDAEDLAMRAAQEAAVNRAVELFQSVEGHQLSMLGATTHLTGQAVERLLEGYVAENVHHLVFPRLSALKRRDDLELEAKIRQMEFIDVDQLGIALQGWTEAKRELTKRLDVAVGEFRKMNLAIGPQQSLKVLLATMRAISHVTDSPEAKLNQTDGDMPDGLTAARGRRGSERTAMTLNADTLVSLLLFVIIRARVKHLEARMLYIRHYIFTEDVDSGEMGYALSTFEAVLVYLDTDSGSLRRASRRNKALWDAVAQGDLVQLKGILEVPIIPNGDSQGGDDDIILESSLSTSSGRRSSSGWSAANGVSSRRSSSVWTSTDRFSLGSDLNHVFPFPTDPPDIGGESPFPPLPRVKRVAMDTRSMSSGSEISYRSRATSTVTLGSSIEGDTSVERLSKTQNSLGESILMMAVQNQREEVLQYLFSLQILFSPQMVLNDMDNNGSTLLSAAVQLGGEAVLHVLVDYLFQARLDEDGVQKHMQLRSYVARQDAQGRSAAHYMFHAPAMLGKLGPLLPWRQRDKNGQTPLFALCRSYDHISYRQMVDEALTLAEAAQADGLPLHVDDHVDAKGNTLLHIVNDGAMVARILHTCDVDVNATNDKKFTPLMVASKYGRFELVRILFADARVDVSAKELRGLTAVELAKDDEVRNRIDDLALFTMPPASDSRTTGVVRSYFIEDATVRFVIKSGAPTDRRSYAITTCRRSLADFELLIKLLAMENPASWIPSLANLRSPIQIPSKPSRAVLRDLQVKMDWLLRILLLHPTFATHEMLWEFFLVPDLQTEQMEQRSKLKTELRAERIREETEPLLDVRDVEQFVDHARDTVRGVHFSTRSVARRICTLSNTATGRFIPPVGHCHSVRAKTCIAEYGEVG
jgi:ankyrin repeat protein